MQISRLFSPNFQWQRNTKHRLASPFPLTCVAEAEAPMVLLRNKLSSRKRPSSSFVSPFPPKIPKPTTTDTVAAAELPQPQPPSQPNDEAKFEKLVSILAEAGCTLVNPSGPPCLPSDPLKLRRHLHRLFSGHDSTAAAAASSLRSDFLSGFSSYIASPENLLRVLTASNRDGLSSIRSDSLVRHLLLVPPIQLDIQNLLLEKLPEYFDMNSEFSGTSLPLENDIARLIVNHFRWLDFIVNPSAFTDKLMQVLSICPIHLKKEIIGSLPEIIGDQNNKTVVDSLEQMLQEDSAIIVPVLDSFSNLYLDEQLQEQVITIALSCIRTIDAEHVSYLLRFLLLSATPANVRRIISQIRQQLKFVGTSNSRAVQHNKLKGKAPADNTEASILDALRSSLRFKNMLCQEIMKELNGLDKPQDHKIIDIWLLMLIYMNGQSLQKTIEKIFKKKIIEECIQEEMFDHCICGNKELTQEYFPSFLSLTEFLLACKELKVREFGMHIYISLFQEFADTYSRQEVLGALVTHVGSGVSFEVGSALDTMALLASKHAQELIPLSSNINGVLDYLEGFSVEDLHKVYGMFSLLALSARSYADSFGSSIANELLMIVRKQVSHPDMKYKKMGLIGTLKIVSCIGDVNNVTCPSPSQKSNCEEALELLKMSLDCCKKFPLPLILFYDELTAMLEYRTLQPAVMEWIGKHVGEFESTFLSDLEGGQLTVKDTYCGLEGELWMNLDGNISPICLNILHLASSSLQTTSLQILPANFLLLSAIERLTNQGSLGGIDALLGCPVHLPSAKYFNRAAWQSLTGKQKQVVCISLYYAVNWMRELLNAFSTQVTGRFECTSQATKQDITAKLLKRLRNLVLLESLLNDSLRMYPLSLPLVHFHVDHCGSSVLNPTNKFGHEVNKIEQKKTSSSTNTKGKSIRKKNSKTPENSDSNCKLRQPTIIDALRKVGAVTSQEQPNEGSSLSAQERASESADQHSCNATEVESIEVSAIAKALETQRFKFRPLLVQCMSLVRHTENQDSCCSDPAAELPLHLYLLRDLHYKLDYFTAGRQLFGRNSSTPIGFCQMTMDELLSKIRPILPSFNKHFNSAVCILENCAETCQKHWKVQSASAGNPDIHNVVLSTSSVSTSVIKEILQCFSKMLNLPDLQRDKSALTNLLEAFQPSNMPDSIFSGIQPCPMPGTIEYLYCGAYAFVEGVLDKACSFSFVLATESLLALESVLVSVQKFLDMLRKGKGKNIHSGYVQGVLPTLQSRLGTSAQKLLRHNWDSKNLENGWKSKGETVQKILRIYLQNSESTPDLLEDFAGSILPQVFLCTSMEDDHHGFPTLCSATFIAWYRVLHEENLSILNKLVKEVVLLEKNRTGAQLESVEKLLHKLKQSVNVVVSLVNICKIHDKITVHGMAVKYGGKFVESFIKVFDFLEAHFETHNELIIKLVTELQKATRTVQTLCSEAKGLKQTVITSKIPATKRSMERFLFHVKALLHTSNGSNFWMGNLKHKDLAGQVVSSQAYVEDQNDEGDENPVEAPDEDQPVSDGGEGEETE